MSLRWFGWYQPGSSAADIALCAAGKATSLSGPVAELGEAVAVDDRAGRARRPSCLPSSVTTTRPRPPTARSAPPPRRRSASSPREALLLRALRRPSAGRAARSSRAARRRRRRGRRRRAGRRRSAAPGSAGGTATITAIPTARARPARAQVGPGARPNQASTRRSRRDRIRLARHRGRRREHDREDPAEQHPVGEPADVVVAERGDRVVGRPVAEVAKHQRAGDEQRDEADRARRGDAEQAVDEGAPAPVGGEPDRAGEAEDRRAAAAAGPGSGRSPRPAGAGQRDLAVVTRTSRWPTSSGIFFATLGLTARTALTITWFASFEGQHQLVAVLVEQRLVRLADPVLEHVLERVRLQHPGHRARQQRLHVDQLVGADVDDLLDDRPGERLAYGLVPQRLGGGLREVVGVEQLLAGVEGEAADEERAPRPRSRGWSRRLGAGGRSPLISMTRFNQSPMAKKEYTTIEAAGHEVRLSSPSKVYFPKPSTPSSTSSSTTSPSRRPPSTSSASGRGR